MATKLALLVSVTHRDADRKGNKLGGTVTSATVKLSNGVIVAGATLGGKYSSAQVLQELRKNPKHFIHHAGYETAKLAGLVP